MSNETMAENNYVARQDLPQVYSHTNTRETLLPLLTQLLPYSLPLLRRIQFHARSPHAVILSTTDPSHPPSVSHTTPSSPDSTTYPTVSPFAAIYLDRSRAPETECWLFSTAELPLPSPDPARIAAHHAAAYYNMLAVLSHAGSLPLPPYPDSEDPTSPRPADIPMLGTLHEDNMRLLKGRGSIDYSIRHEETGLAQASEPNCKVRGNPTEGGLIRGHTIIWLKYIFPPADESTGASGAGGSGRLPGGLQWTDVNDEDVKLVIARSSIRRTPSTIRQWAGAAVRETSGEYAGKLAAWAFIAADGSLATLHVEERWRRKGLAKLMAGRLKAEIGKVTVSDGKGSDARQRLAFEGIGRDTWVHSDTGDYNKSAQGVLGGIGGKVGWKVYWTWVDLGLVSEEASKLRA